MRWKFLKLDCLFYLFSHYNSTQNTVEEVKSKGKERGKKEDCDQIENHIQGESTGIDGRNSFGRLCRPHDTSSVVQFLYCL